MLNVYYINLKRSLKRNQNMIEQLKHIDGIHYTRIEAIDGNDKNDLKQVLHVPKKQSVSPNELGAFASHLKAIMTAYNNNLEEVIIMEDDINLFILQHTIDKLKQLWDVVKHSTDILQLHANGNNTHDTLYKNIKSDDVFRMVSKPTEYKSILKNDNWGMTAYLINRVGMMKIMRYNYKKMGIFNFYEYRNYSFISDVIIYMICQTLMVDIPFVNIENPHDFPSTIRNKDVVQPITYSFIERNKDIIIKSINNRKLVPRNIHLFQDIHQPSLTSQWNIYIWTYDKMKTFIGNEYSEYLNFYVRLSDNNKLIFFSYICLYHHGGMVLLNTLNIRKIEQLSIYMLHDIKLFFESSSHDKHLICDKYHYVSNKPKVRNDMMMCIKNHDFMKRLIQYCIHEYDEDADVFEYFISFLYYSLGNM